jgi:predicted Zn-dependent peptidase
MKEINFEKSEISEEVKDLHTHKLSEKDRSKIRDRIRNGFYNSDEVVNKVAELILKEFDQKKESN